MDEYYGNASLPRDTMAGMMIQTIIDTLQYITDGHCLTKRDESAVKYAVCLLQNLTKVLEIPATAPMKGDGENDTRSQGKKA